MTVLRWLVIMASLTSTSLAGAQTLELYVDTVTKQVYTEPGPNRTKLGVFQQVDETAAAIATNAPAEPGAPLTTSTTVASAIAAASSGDATSAEPTADEVSTGRAGLSEAGIGEVIARKLDEELPVKVSYGSKGLGFASRDGNWSTNLQWRAQLRYSNPFLGDPRQLDDFESPDTSNFEARRLRMKIGGHGFVPWLTYYFEVDLQPSRASDDEAADASARVIDWRGTIEKYDWANLRLGQWKIDYNRERVDSSGRQQFVERSIVTRVFTVDRQVGAQLSGRLFAGSPADLRYYAGVYTGEGRGVTNDDENMMYMGRLQWNFLGRDVPWSQTDVEYTKDPLASLAFGAVTNKGRCTRWSSEGCGNLDGFTRPAFATDGQFKVEQLMQEFAFKWRGLAVQEEFHWKTVADRVAGTKNDFMGAYAEIGYFFHDLFPVVPAPLELAFRYAFVDEPNELDRALDNNRDEYTLGLNWFFSGHNNKVTMDVAHLTLEDEFFDRQIDEELVRLQWDVSF